MHPIYHFATFQEAQVSIEELNTKQLSPHLYQFDKGFILISGIGLNATLYHLMQLDAKSVINLGCVGALKNSLPLFELIEVSKVSLFLPSYLHLEEKNTTHKHIPTIELQPHGLHLASSHYPIKTPYTKTHALEYDIIDMEGYSVAYFAKQKNISCKMIKVISDFSNEGSVIKGRLGQVSQILYEYLKKSILQNSTLI
jgi:nucleoside phosphorylase